MFKRYIHKYIKENRNEIFIIAIMLIVGIISGIIMFALIRNESIYILIESMNETLSLSTNKSFVKMSIVLNAAKNNALLIVVMLFLSITLIGRGCIYAITLLKGIILGIYTCILLQIFGIGYGALVVLMQVILVNVIYIPAYIYLAVELILFNLDLFKIRTSGINLYTKLATKIGAVFVVMFSSSIIEQIFTNISLNLYSKL